MIGVRIDMGNDLSILIASLFFGVIMMVIVISPMIIVARSLDSMACRKAAEDMRIEYKFDFIGGCKYKVDNRLVPSRNYRHITKGE